MSELVWIKIQLRRILGIPALCQLLVRSTGWVTSGSASVFGLQPKVYLKLIFFFSKIGQAAALLGEVNIDYNK